MTNSTTRGPSLQCSLQDEGGCEWGVCRRRAASDFPDSIYSCMSIRVNIEIFEPNSPAVPIDPISETDADYVHIFSRDVTLQTEVEEVDEIDEVLVAFRVFEGTL